MDDLISPVPSDKKGSNYQDAMLMNVWRILFKRRWVIFGILIISLIAACLHVYLAPPIYESTAILNIGQVSPTILLEQPPALIERIKEKYSISVGPGRVGGTVLLSARSSTPETAQKTLVDVTATVIQEHDRLYLEARSLQEKRVTLLQQQIKAMDAEVNYYEATSKNMNEVSNDKFALGWEKDRVIRLRADLERQLAELAFSMTKIIEFPTQMSKEPTLPVMPIAPKISYELSVAGIGGVIFGIFAAFCIEFIATLRRKGNK